MRKFLCLLITLTTLLSFVGCNGGSKDTETSVHFYYLTQPIDYDNGAILPESRESAGYENNLIGLMQLYMDGPISQGFRNPFPSKVEVKNVIVNERTAEIQLSESFSQLSNVQMTAACACLTMTVLEITQRHKLIITALDDAGNIVYTASMTQEQLIFTELS